jgi:L-aspartate oxidase
MARCCAAPGGERFVDELQPRDIVARAIVQQAKLDGRDFVWLDARPIADFALAIRR